jgi:cation diffusion facilitator family transporter
MSHCCHDKVCELAILRSKKQITTLKMVLAINIVMFIIEFIAGILINSTALLGDSMDMLGDALVYGFSLYVVTGDTRSKALAALFKGLIMLSFGIFVLGQASYKLLFPDLPNFEMMSFIGLLALLANTACFILLWQHRQQDINMRSVWLCSRNDIIANISVLIAAGGVALTQSPWPDIVIGFALAGLFLHSAFSILREAIKML